MTTPAPNRRPLASRDTRAARALAGALARAGIAPNAISAASVVAAALGAGAFLVGARTGAGSLGIAAFVVAAAGVQLRLLCNLMDGMVAVEWDRKSPAGEVWNELPDRIADVVLFVAVGHASGAVELGWAAAVLAVTTAYVRALGGVSGLPQSFAGPMAKPQRMAVLTLAALAAAALRPSGLAPAILELALWIVVAGAIVTAARRTIAIVRALEARAR